MEILCKSEAFRLSDEIEELIVFLGYALNSLRIGAH